MNTNNPRHAIEVRAELYDIDFMDVVWHGNYLRYFESARAALLEKYNYGYIEMRKSGFIWPIVDIRFKFVFPTTYGEVLRIEAEVIEWENRLKIQYRAIHPSSGKVSVEGYTIQMAVHDKTKESLMVCPVVLWERLGVAAE